MTNMENRSPHKMEKKEAEDRTLPLSAFIICVNEERYIGNCIESLDLCREIVIVDSGSTDGTLPLIQSYIDKGWPIRLFSEPWRGYAGQKQFARWIRSELDRLRSEGSLPGTQPPPSSSGSSNGGSSSGSSSGSRSPIPAKDRPEVIIGNQGAMVKELQIALNENGAKIWTDGDFGPGTERAVKAFQRKVGLVPDGRVGPKTWKALGF